ncbi:CinA family protein [Microbacterium sp. CFBP9034]|uniref:CinA family protein n=1 Tax=Microbacterium sp. CFBP9034 TaxID=3096540 RepID=UPI002A6B7EA8|nr:CinA family protein [Microbacterium sp. CFBP9034]MDY0909453.1 CinA family protein [Microbacterium sp. CFBP9034]
MTDLSQQLSEAARRRGLRIAVAESLTCGLVAAGAGKGGQAEEWFGGGVVAYQSRTKESVLGVDAGIDPTSARCAEQLARGVRTLLDADVALSTTGVGGPDAEEGHPPGTVFLGWATAERTGHRELALEGDPEQILAQTVDAALGLLIEVVEGGVEA